MAKFMTLLVWNLFVILWGFFSLAITIAITVIDGSILTRRSKNDTANLVKAQDELWNLSSIKYGNHRFLELENGARLHYVERRSLKNTTQIDATPKNLVIFFHGFPDSWALWQDYLEFPDHLEDACLIALDLPGHGGSDALQNYGPDLFLGSIIEFIIAMREQYLPESHQGNKVLIVAHDWGAVLAFRLAAETPQIADHFIVSNSVLPDLAKMNFIDRSSSAVKMTKTWLHRLRSSPRHFGYGPRLLSTAFSTFFPVIRQLVMSHYVFIFQLPKPLPAIYGRLGNFWFLHKAHCHASSKQPSPLSTSESASAFASSLGPNIADCNTQTADGSTYGISVRTRAQRVDGGFPEKIRLYREGLLTLPWSKSLQILAFLHNLKTLSGDSLSKRRKSTSGFGGGLFEDGLAGVLKAPCTVIWGAKDVALEQRICLDGMASYLGVKRSQVILLPKGGHWVLTEPDGRRVMRTCLMWSLEGKGDDLRDRVQVLGTDAKFLVDT